MDQFYIYTEHSPWLIPLCLALGALYALALYSKNPPWSKNTNRGLAVLRFLLASFLLFLLLAPFVRYISNEAKKPVVAIAIDNSLSVKLFSDSTLLRNALSRVDALTRSLAGADYEVKLHTLDGQHNASASETPFTATATNLNSQLQTIGTDYEGQNLAGVVLLSDGIVNQGQSPLYSTFRFPVYTVGLGDTAVQQDVVMASLLYNKVSYSGNRFPLVAELHHTGFDRRPATVVLSDGSNELERRQVTLPAGASPVQVNFTVAAGRPGKRHYMVRVIPLPGEFTDLNNSKHAYINVIEGRLKVLIAAAAPHPDIKAMRQALEAEDNIEVSVFMPGISPLKTQGYDLVILHQIPSLTGLGSEALDLVSSRKTPALYLVGLQSDISALNRLNLGLNIAQRGGSQTDQVTPVFNPGFSRFNMAQELQRNFSEYPPVEVPFADYKVSPALEVILKQKVGSVGTDKPLLLVQAGSQQNRAFLLGDGIWEWRLQEHARHQSSEAFDKLFQNLAQLLTIKENKKKLNVYPVSEEFTEAQQVQFEADAYNEVYQKIYGQRIALTLTDEKGSKRSFSFVNGENFSRFTLGSLPEGVYRYTASAEINGRTETDQGEFSVQSLQLEALNSQANHNLLYQLSAATNGRFFPVSQLDSLESYLRRSSFRPVLYSTERVQELINLKWIFFVLLALLSTEWFLRKYKGSY